MCTCMFFFFFSSRRRHTRWTGDWSSDVCSSDLKPDYPTEALPYGIEATTIVKVTIAAAGDVVSAQTVKWRLAFEREIDDRSEERRVGKECRSRWSAEQQRTNKTRR